VVVIGQLAQFTRIEGLPLGLVLGLLATGEQHAGAVEQLPLPLARLDRVASQG